MNLSSTEHHFTAEGVPCPKCGVHLEDPEAGQPCEERGVRAAALMDTSAAITLAMVSVMVGAIALSAIPYIQKARIALSPPFHEVIEENADTRVHTE